MKEQTEKSGTPPENTALNTKRKLVMPDTYIIVAVIVLVMAALTRSHPSNTFVNLVAKDCLHHSG